MNVSYNESKIQYSLPGESASLKQKFLLYDKLFQKFGEKISTLENTMIKNSDFKVKHGKHITNENDQPQINQKGLSVNELQQQYQQFKQGAMDDYRLSQMQKKVDNVLMQVDQCQKQAQLNKQELLDKISFIENKLTALQNEQCRIDKKSNVDQKQRGDSITKGISNTIPSNQASINQEFTREINNIYTLLKNCLQNQQKLHNDNQVLLQRLNFINSNNVGALPSDMQHSCTNKNKEQITFNNNDCAKNDKSLHLNTVNINQQYLQDQPLPTFQDSYRKFFVADESSNKKNNNFNLLDDNNNLSSQLQLSEIQNLNQMNSPQFASTKQNKLSGNNLFQDNNRVNAQMQPSQNRGVTQHMSLNNTQRAKQKNNISSSVNQQNLSFDRKSIQSQHNKQDSFDLNNQEYSNASFLQDDQVNSTVNGSFLQSSEKFNSVNANAECEMLKKKNKDKKQVTKNSLNTSEILEKLSELSMQQNDYQKSELINKSVALFEEKKKRIDEEIERRLQEESQKRDKILGKIDKKQQEFRDNKRPDSSKSKWNSKEIRNLFNQERKNQEEQQ